MKKRISLLLVFTLSLALLLGGCGDASPFSSAGSGMTTAETAAAGARSYDLGFYDSELPLEPPPTALAPSPQEIFEEDTAVEEKAAVNGTTAQESSDLPTPLTRKLIRNMDLQVETTDFDPLIASLQAKVAEYQGYIEQSDISGNSITNQGRPSKKTAHMTLRIPAEKLDLFISQVEAAGNIIYKSESVSDVTLQYSDIESRLKTLRMEQERLWELLAQADSTESIVLLEERLTEVSSEIESCESRMRYLDNSVTYSTVYLTIDEVDIESPTQPETAWQQIQRGFTRNLIDLMDNLTQFMISLLSNLPVILFLALLVFIIVMVIRRVHRRRSAKAPRPPKPFPASSIHFSRGSNQPLKDNPQAGKTSDINAQTADTQTYASQPTDTQTTGAQTANSQISDTLNKEDEA